MFERHVWLREVDDHKNGPKRHLAISKSFFLNFFYVLLTIVFRYHLRFKDTLWLREVDENGPKRRLGHWKVLFYFLCFINTNYLYLDTIYVWKTCCGFGKATTTNTGPNDASGVVWAISKCFYLFILCFMTTNYY